jgi:hypothetical protein
MNACVHAPASLGAPWHHQRLPCVLMCVTCMRCVLHVIHSGENVPAAAISLLQVKISLLLDTTSWKSGLYATPPVRRHSSNSLLCGWLADVPGSLI